VRKGLSAAHGQTAYIRGEPICAAATPADAIGLDDDDA